MQSDVNPTDTELKQWGFSTSGYEALREEHEQTIQLLATQTSLQRLIFRQSKHLNFTDLPLIFKLSKMASLVGEADGFELSSASSKKLIEFFSN